MNGGFGRRGIGLDSNVVTYLAEAMADGYEPDADRNPRLRLERVGAMRVFLYLGELFVPPRAHTEIDRMSDRARLEYHQMIKDVLLAELANLDEPTVNSRTDHFLSLHPHENDARILAEVEVGGLSHLLTMDERFTTHLSGHTAVEMISPSAFWEKQGFPNGSRPRWEPSPGNPLAAAKWWRW